MKLCKSISMLPYFQFIRPPKSQNLKLSILWLQSYLPWKFACCLLPYIRFNPFTPVCSTYTRLFHYWIWNNIRLLIFCFRGNWQSTSRCIQLWEQSFSVRIGYCCGCSVVLIIPRCGPGDLGSNPINHTKLKTCLMFFHWICIQNTTENRWNYVNPYTCYHTLCP